MVRNVPNTGREKIVSPKKDVPGAQRIRLRRFGMAGATYLVVIAAVLGHPAWARGDDRCAVGNLHRAGVDRQRRVLLFVLHKRELALFRCVPDLGTDRLLGLVGHGAAVRVARGASRGVDVLSARFHLWHATPDSTSISSAAACVMALYASVLGLEYFQGRQGFRLQYELFLFVLFGILMTWFAFFGGFVSDMRRRLRLRNEEILEAHERIERDIAARKQVEEERNSSFANFRRRWPRLRC